MNAVNEVMHLLVLFSKFFGDLQIAYMISVYQYLLGPLADLELALLDYVSSVVEQKGFKPVVVPDIVHESIPESCGLQQRSDKDILYRVENHSDLCLSGTSGWWFSFWIILLF